MGNPQPRQQQETGMAFLSVGRECHSLNLASVIAKIHLFPEFFAGRWKENQPRH